MSLTGYITQSGIDLSYIFQPGNSGIVTGYKLIDGQDIGSIFAAYSSNLAFSTGLLSVSGFDINTLFNGVSSNLAFPFSIAGCCLWLDSSDITTITKDGSNKVSNWSDKSQNGFQFGQSTAGNKPTYTANNQNGKATITFNATNLTYLMGPSNFAIGTSSYSLFVICSYTSDTSYGSVFAKALYGTQTGRIIISKDSAGFSICYTHGDTRIAAITTTYTAGAYRLFELIVNRIEGKDYAYQNGILLGSLTFADSATNYTANTSPMLIGAYNNSTGGVPPQAGYYLTGNVAEVLSYKGGEMTYINRCRIEGYLAWKWGIQNTLSTNHTYKNAAPPISISDTPIPLRMGCCLWLDATDTSTLTMNASNKVSKWIDKSRNAFQFVQNTLGNQPTYTANSQNGKATITFASASSNYLAGPANFAIGTSSFALFAVCNFSDATSAGTVFAKSFYGNQTGRFFINRDAGATNATLNMIYVHSSTWLTSTSDTYTPVGSYRLLELVVNRTEGKDYSYQNGNQLSTLTITDTTNYTANSNLMLIGAYNNTATTVISGYFLNGNVAEIIAYKDMDLDKSTRETIEGYLAWKWGLQARLPGTHAYKNSAPT